MLRFLYLARSRTLQKPACIQGLAWPPSTGTRDHYSELNTTILAICDQSIIRLTRPTYTSTLLGGKKDEEGRKKTVKKGAAHISSQKRGWAAEEGEGLENINAPLPRIGAGNNEFPGARGICSPLDFIVPCLCKLGFGLDGYEIFSWYRLSDSEGLLLLCGLCFLCASTIPRRSIRLSKL